MATRRKRLLLILLAVTASLLVLYIGTYIALSASGEYRASQTGRLRWLPGGLSVTDVEHWQPAHAEWAPFRDVNERDTIRGNLLGFLYSPLIRIDRAWCHPSHYAFELSTTTRPAAR